MPQTLSLPVLIGILAVLIIISIFFSASETSMMAVNRYKLRHLADDKHHRGAKRVLALLARTDKLLSVILIGNTVANIFASAVATLIGAQLYGETGVLIATVCLTLIILLFSEIGPKSIMAKYPQNYALFAAIPLKVASYLFYPLVLLGNGLVRFVLKPFKINISHAHREELSAEELKHIVRETDASISIKDEQMLVGILELDKITVQDIMIPRAEIIGINLEDDWNVIFKQIMSSHHTRLPLYSKNLGNVYGILHMRDLLSAFANGDLNKDKLTELASEAHFAPETTRLDQQLIQFQKRQLRIAFVVDEYGEIHGLITLDDILEEVVGDYTTNIAETTDTDIIPQEDGSYIIDGSIMLRDLNRSLQIKLPTDQGRTLNGLITSYLDEIPSNGVCLCIADYRMEVIKVSESLVKTVKLYPIQSAAST